MKQNYSPTFFVAFSHDILNAYNQMCEPLLQKFGISQVSFDILMFLKNNPELCTAQQISMFRNIKKNLVSVHVEKLVKAGYLKRGAVSGDRRKIALFCTEKAVPITDAGIALQTSFVDQLTADIPQRELTLYRKLMETMAEHARSMTAEPSSAKPFLPDRKDDDPR